MSRSRRYRKGYHKCIKHQRFTLQVHIKSVIKSRIGVNALKKKKVNKGVRPRNFAYR